MAKKNVKKEVKKDVKKDVKNDKKDVEDGKIFAFLGVFLHIIGFVIVMLAKKDNKYAMYYAKQGLVLFIAGVIIGILSIIPILGWFIIMPLGNLLLVILWIIGWINALSGEIKPIPLIGKYAEEWKI
ncbi:MAG: hypothetical protein ABIG89_01635 [Candidatus Woesearchaeota archaeon]